MGRRLEVELTSIRDDGTWTWRAAGARQPKGDMVASLLYEGAKVGDVVKVEADFHLDGIEVTEVFAPKEKRERTDLLELKTRPLRDDELVTTQRVGRGGRRGERRGGRDRDRHDERDGRRRGERRGARPEADRRPKPKRLRPKRVHRDALLAAAPDEHRPIVEQVIRDGMPGVRAAIDKQNTEAREAGKPEIDAAPIVAIAERNLGAARLAEWRDRADAALADAGELDLRDLRSVVVAGADVARDDESRQVLDQLKKVLDQRLESDHTQWLSELDAAVADGRVVRGLRLSSRPVKAGAPLPTEVASRLAQQASEALAPDVGQDRWATVLDALAYSPVRGAVTPVGVPTDPSEELMAEVRRLSDRVPGIAALFGVDPAQVPKSARRRRSRRQKGRSEGKPQADKPSGGDAASKEGAPKDRAPTENGADIEDQTPPPTEDQTPPPTEDQTPPPTEDQGPADDQAGEPGPAGRPVADRETAPGSGPDGEVSAVPAETGSTVPEATER